MVAMTATISDVLLTFAELLSAALTSENLSRYSSYQRKLDRASNLVNQDC